MLKDTNGRWTGQNAELKPVVEESVCERLADVAIGPGKCDYFCGHDVL